MRVAIIGAGYAGMAAAAELAARGIPVTVFEASRTLGGRARRVESHGYPLDNGQHILVGAYVETAAPDAARRRWLDEQKTPSRQRRLLWEPLCIAALNTPADRASAQVLANVLRDSLGGAREASDMLLPQVDLTALFPGPATDFVRQRGGRVHFGTRITELRREGDAWRIDAAGPFDRSGAGRGALSPRRAAARAGIRRGAPGVGTHRHRLLQLSRHGAPPPAHARRRWRLGAVAVRPRRSAGRWPRRGSPAPASSPARR
jgi:predicted NAD/FAD-binding protein